ncbi:MAG: hypothetical protein FWC27_13725 [Firmicutes bacterium]|nr:hypothetical protein [Bacillota bacterium]
MELGRESVRLRKTTKGPPSGKAWGAFSYTYAACLFQDSRRIRKANLESAGRIPVDFIQNNRKPAFLSDAGTGAPGEQFAYLLGHRAIGADRSLAGHWTLVGLIHFSKSFLCYLTVYICIAVH